MNPNKLERIMVLTCVSGLFFIAGVLFPESEEFKGFMNQHIKATHAKSLKEREQSKHQMQVYKNLFPSL